MGGRGRFFDGDDFPLDRNLLAENCRAAEVAVWAWCLMPNHVHLILVPADADGLRRALAATARYVSLNSVRTRLVGRAQEWRWSSVWPTCPAETTA